MWVVSLYILFFLKLYIQISQKPSYKTYNLLIKLVVWLTLTYCGKKCNWSLTSEAIIICRKERVWGQTSIYLLLSRFAFYMKFITSLQNNC